MITRERERERERATPQSNLPPTTPTGPKEPKKSNQPKPLDNSLSLEQLQAQIKNQHNLSEAEFAAIIVPVQDKKVVSEISFLLGAVREAQQNIKQMALVDSSCEVLMAYREASEEAQKKAYQAVNSYQNQVDRLITELTTIKKLINDCLTEMILSQDEQKLNEVYETAKSLEQYQQSEVQRTIDRHKERVQAAIKIENQEAAKEMEKQLAQKLRTVINGDTGKEVLLQLQAELERFQTAAESEKQGIYETNQEIVDGMLSEIEQELTRRNHSIKGSPAKDNFKEWNPNSPSSNLTLIVSLSMIGGIIVLVPFLVYLHRRKKFKKVIK